MSWRRPPPVESYILSEQELLNRVILAKALIAICGNVTITLRTKEGNFEITPTLAKKLLRESKAAEGKS